VVEAVFDEKRFLGVLRWEGRMFKLREAKERTVWWRIGTFASFSFCSAVAAATASRRAFFSALVSGRYLFRSLNSWVAVFLSRVWENWAIAGGTLRR